ncbi:MAG TPA: Gmad2 immunoglobulin-like domain-containing protein, partial [Thermoanaerobaculia bacterium]
MNQTADQPVDSTVAKTSEPADPAPAKPAEPQREITIEEVDVANPIVVKGRARTFENNVVVRARGADGKIITETFTTSEGESGQHNPYRATIWLARDPGDRVTIEALEYSAKDGS